MKISAKKYATALFEATAGKGEKEVKEAIERFVRILFENKDSKKAEMVIKYFVKTWNKNKGITVVDVLTKEKADEDVIKLLNEFIKKMLGAKELEIRQKVDKSIIGGVIIKHGDVIYDASLKTKVGELRNKLIK